MDVTTPVTSLEVTVARHCVASSPETGLSPLQTDLIQHPAPVRVADAPTGAGKSYAFERAMADRGERILFVVPTRRLCQNLAAGLRESLMRIHGWSESRAGAKIAIWNSDESLRLRNAGVERIGTRRLREISDLNDAVEGGEMIITVPEVVSGLLLRPYPEKSLSDKGVFDILMGFEHVVFDEFHTISPRGFGLAGVFAKLAAEYPGVRAKVSFLSATALNILPVLHGLGIPEDRVACLSETLTSEGRAVHGDVRLVLCRCAAMTDLLRERIGDLVHEREEGRQVVIIYNQLADLQRQLPELESLLRSAGVGPGRALLVDSLDDSRAGGNDTGYFATGRDRDPLAHEVLIATASVEMGVTFRANLLLMEPGFYPMNFLQRYGRAARGDHGGQVWVRHDEALESRLPWFRELRRWVEEHRGRVVSIHDLTGVLSRSARRRFGAAESSSERHFGEMPSRAAFTTGLYWNELERHFSNRGHRGNHLRELSPKPAKRIGALLGEVRKMEKDPVFGPACVAWREGFERECRTLRDIGAAVLVREREGRGSSFRVSETWLRRNTDIPREFPLLVGEDGMEEFRISGVLGDHLLERKNWARPVRHVRFPHTEYTAALPDDVALVESWLREFTRREGAESMAWEDHPDGMKAAEDLVRLTGLVVSAENEPEGEHMVW